MCKTADLSGVNATGVSEISTPSNKTLLMAHESGNPTSRKSRAPISPGNATVPFALTMAGGVAGVPGVTDGNS
jgi:hypothetical protein